MTGQLRRLPRERCPPLWRWANLPLPEPHLLGLGAGFLTDRVAPWTPSWPSWIGHALGWPSILAGLSLAAWAVRTAANVELARPDQLVRGGPYALTRNPMYVAWTLGYVGIALAASAAGPLLLLPVVLLATHIAVVREERSLARQFGIAYRSYQTSVRRYL